MKKLRTLLLLSAILFSGKLSAQTWTAHNAGTVAIIGEISFPTNDTGYAITDAGQIHKTLDGAITWSTVTNPPTQVYFINFITGQTGFSFGDSLIYKTNNGGTSWVQVASDNEITFTKMFFPSPSIGYACSYMFSGDSSRIYKTINGGNSWTKISTILCYLTYQGLFFNSTTSGFLATYGNVYSTTNGGASFNSVYNDPSQADDFFNVHFPNVDTGYVVGNFNTFLKSTDGGATWSPTTYPGNVGYDIYFFNGQKGFVCGGNGFNSGWVQQTSNCGASWTPSYTSSYSFYCMDFPSDTVGYVGGDNGTVLKFSGTPNGISEKNNSNHINIFPNPATEFVEVNNLTPNSKITLLNFSGQNIMELTTENNSEKINLQNISPGIYFIEIVNDNQTITQKLIVY